MRLAEIKTAVESLTEDERKELVAFCGTGVKNGGLLIARTEEGGAGVRLDDLANHLGRTTAEARAAVEGTGRGEMSAHQLNFWACGAEGKKRSVLRSHRNAKCGKKGCPRSKAWFVMGLTLRV